MKRLVREFLSRFFLVVLFSGCEIETFEMPGGESDLSDAETASREEDAAVAFERDDSGPECILGSLERCNQRDDNCDGLTDEGFDLSSDPRHCGKCDNGCRFENAESLCEQGECRQGSCFPGFADLSAETPGCEYRCPVFPPQGEQCNGIDDDCDGKVDEPEDLAGPRAGLCKVTEGTPCENTVAICTSREGTTTWYCDYPEEVDFDPTVPNGIAGEESRCDGVDEDCDGVVDETYPMIGVACTLGIGACTSRGVFVCNETMDDVVCDASEPISGSSEVCNGVDDDCDGEIDEDGFGEMVEVSDGEEDSFWIDRYEASRPKGQSNGYACSVAGAMPWVNVSWLEASAACEAASKRLCTEQEWELACAGLAGNPYPYGESFDPEACNGVTYDPDCKDEDDDALQPTATACGCSAPPSESLCVSDFGAYDMSGNVKEWTGTLVSEDPETYRIRGGSLYEDAPGLTCQFDFLLGEVDFFFDNLGFRCCSDEEP
ncbi:MAG: SUMF1/EgtB/PvdO family nonheme iron enzyme [Deltaproteobacteria bacterium]|nr:SUMF1/EgtB/PvdO family nonheme iron enzyme [Deltaproteobacteria bacterium]